VGVWGAGRGGGGGGRAKGDGRSRDGGHGAATVRESECGSRLQEARRRTELAGRG
jgi:hypothetical protein